MGKWETSAKKEIEAEAYDTIKTRPGDLVVADPYDWIRNQNPKSHYLGERSQVGRGTPQG